MEKEVRPIDANALAKRIREYMDNFPYAGTRLATCRVVLSMLGDEGQTPTLQPNCDKLQLNCNPITLEQLRKMDGQPVWVKVIGKTGIRCDGWCEVEIREKDPFAYVWWPGSEVEDIAKIEDYGKTWSCYAYQPAHIDREVWEPCAKCVGCGNCYYFLYDDDEYPCDKCSKGSTAKNPYPEFKPIGFCKHCGRPLTEKAWVELEKRLDFGHMLNWVSVEERLPRDGQSVLVWCSSRMLTKHVSFSTFYEGKWSRGVKEVTHWMPLPEPPKED